MSEPDSRQQIHDAPDSERFAGSCPSCLGTGWLHGKRNGRWGVISDALAGGRLVRCDCEAGERITRELAKERERRERY